MQEYSKYLPGDKYRPIVGTQTIRIIGDKATLAQVIAWFRLIATLYE
jgi:hypothetical protein